MASRKSLFYIFAWNSGSNGAKELSEALGIKRIRHEGSKFVGRADRTIINWGSSSLDGINRAGDCTILNKPVAVTRASNKLNCFSRLAAADVRIPPYTDQRMVAETWLPSQPVVVRHVLNGSGGKGIEIVEKGALPAAPLYTGYIKKKDEYRVHFCAGKIIAVQRKARRKDIPDDKVNWQVRNHDNGFVFLHIDREEAPVDVISQSSAAIKALGLDFGAVDVIWNDSQKSAYVLEVNTAPGLEGETITRYVEAFRSLMPN